jgi:hypothetical protein
VVVVANQMESKFLFLLFFFFEFWCRWLMVTAWNSGLSCMKVGDHGHGERYLGVSIRFGQMNVAGTGGKRKIAADDEMADMVEYYTSNNFISGRGRQISSGKQHSP